jgi:hypothetical protein
MPAPEIEPGDIPQDPEERKELIECLALAYGVTPRDKEGIYFNYGKLTQKELADQLGYDNSTLGKMLKPDWINATNRSYKPLIACLRKQIEINRLRKERKKSNMPVWVTISLLLLLVASNALWVINRSEPEQPRTHTEKHIVETEGEFAALFSGEGGEAVAELLAEEAYTLLKDIRDTLNAGKEPSEAQKREAIFRFQSLARQIDGAVRDQMRSLNYVAVFNEKNVVDIMDHITPRDSLFKCPPEAMLLDSCPDCARRSDAHFDDGLWRMRHFLLKQNLSKEEFKAGVKSIIRGIQQKLSTEDMEVFRHFKETGELKRPDYGH